MLQWSQIRSVSSQNADTIRNYWPDDMDRLVIGRRRVRRGHCWRVLRGRLLMLLSCLCGLVSFWYVSAGRGSLKIGWTIPCAWTQHLFAGVCFVCIFIWRIEVCGGFVLKREWEKYIPRAWIRHHLEIHLRDSTKPFSPPATFMKVFSQRCFECKKVR